MPRYSDYKKRSGLASAYRYAKVPAPDLNDSLRAGECFDESDVRHDAAGRDSDLWEPPPPDDVVFQHELRDALGRALGTLDEREELWIRIYYGLPFPDKTMVDYRTRGYSHHKRRRVSIPIIPGYPRTLEEIGEWFGYTRERVHQVIAAGLRRLKHHSRGLRAVLHPEREEKTRNKRRSKRTRRSALLTQVRTPEPVRPDVSYQILSDKYLPNYVREPVRARLMRERAVGKTVYDQEKYGYQTPPYQKWHAYRQLDVVCGICGDEYLSKWEQYDPPVYVCYRCQKFVPVKRVCE